MAKLYKITIDKPEPPFYYGGWTSQDGKGDIYYHSSESEQLKSDMDKYDWNAEDLKNGTNEDMATGEHLWLKSFDAKNHEEWYNESNGGGKYCKVHGDIAKMDDLTDRIKNQEFLQDEHIVMSILIKLRRFQIRSKPIDVSHKKDLQDTIHSLKGDMSTWTPIILLEDMDGEGDHALFQGNHTTLAAKDSGIVFSIPYQLIPKKVWSQLTYEELETVCRRLNPQIKKKSKPMDDKEAITWIVDQHLNKGISTDSDVIYEEMQKWGYERRKITRSLIYQADKDIKDKKGIPSNHIIIDYKEGPDKDWLEKKERRHRTDKSDSWSMSSGYFKLDKFLNNILDNASEKKKDRLESIRIFVYHESQQNKDTWEETYQAEVLRQIKGINKISSDEYKVNVELETLPFTRINPIQGG